MVLTEAYREAAGVKELVEELPEGATVGDLLSRLASRYGGVFKDVADPDQPGWVSRDVIVLVNSTTVHKLSHELRDGDVVTVADLLEVSLSDG